MLVKDSSRFIFLSLAIAFATVAIFPSLIEPTVFSSLAIIFVSAVVVFFASLFSKSYKRFLQNNTNFFYFSIFLALFAVTRGATSSNPYESIYGVFPRYNGSILIISLVLLLLTVSISYSNQNIDFLIGLLLVLGLIQSILAVSQFFGFRLFEYENPYSPMIGTFGNPNFLSAFLGFCSLVAVFVVWKKRKNRLQLTLSLLLIPMSIFIFIASQSIQGLGMMASGLTVFFLLSSRNRIDFSLRASLILLLGFLAIIGILGRGPLSDFLSQQSNVYRWHYWEAAFAGIVARPLFGYGPDQFRDLYSLHRSSASIIDRPEVIADNAHNWFLQIGATYGLVFLALFLMMIFFISVRGFKFFLVNKKESSVLLFLGLWVAFLFCALISVETSSIASWGFLFAGCLISISQDIKLFGPSSYSSSGIKQPLRNTKIQQSRLYMTLFSSFLISFLVLTPAIKAINLITNIEINSSLNDPKLDTDTSDVLFLGKGDRNQLLIIANSIYQSGDTKRAKEVLEDFRSKFPAEYRFVDYLAQIAEAEGELNLALEYRLQIAKLNPKFVRNLENLRKLAEQLDEREAFDLANKLYQSIFP